MKTFQEFVSPEKVDFAKNVPVVDLISRIVFVPNKRRGNIQILCPFHAEKTPSFNINVPGNFFKCHGCGVGGHGAISFMKQYHFGPQFKNDHSKFLETVKLICEIMNPTDIDIKESVKLSSRNIRKSTSKTNTSLTKLANHLLLDLLTLSDSHMQHLLKIRKLSKEVIQMKGYRSFPEKPSRVAAAMAEKLTTLTGVPGFYLAKSKRDDGTYWTIKGTSGFLIPVRNEKQEIMGFQIRVDRPLWNVTCLDRNNNPHKLLSASLDYSTMTLSVKWNGMPFDSIPITEPKSVHVKSNGKFIGTVHVKPRNKYIWLASPDLPQGSGVTASYHIAVPTSFVKKKRSPIGVKRVGITEGPLKGDIAAEILNIPFACMPGLSNWRSCVEGALALNAEEYVIYLDADALTEMRKDKTTGEQYEDIGNTIVEVVKELIHAGKKVIVAAWDKEVAKGIDDLLLANYIPKEFSIN